MPVSPRRQGGSRKGWKKGWKSEVALTVDPAVEMHPYTPKDLRGARPTNLLNHILAAGKVVNKDGAFLLKKLKFFQGLPSRNMTCNATPFPGVRGNSTFGSRIRPQR